MRKFIFTLMLAIAGSVWTISEAKVTEQLEDDPCSQYTLFVEPHIDSTVTYMFTGELLHNQPYVDSVWITGVREDSATIYLVSYAQPNEKIDLSSSLRMGRYFFFAQIEDCVKVRPLNFRGRWATDFPKGMTWTTFFTPYEGCDSWSYTCELQDNTFIEGRSYSIVHGPVDIPIRQYGQKIYAWINNKDYLLYDFGLEIGDSIPQYYFGISADASQIDVYGQVYAHVLRIDSVLLEDGRKAKRLWYDGRMPDIEYVGSEYGILSPIIMPDITTCGGTHMCCSLDGGLIYETEPGICNSIGELHPLRLPSLCDTWNVLFVRMGANGDELSTEVHRLTTDTIINGKTYVQLYIYGNYGVRDRVTYRGALREDNNANVYIVPANSDHEYLLYAFNAKVGDKLSNLWIGGAAETGGLPDGLNATVADITETSPRIFTLYLNANDNMDVIEDLPIQWIEGVGLTDCPGGSICPGILGCACSCGHIMLCAYKDGKQVYASEEAEKYGCYYDSYEQAGDTVKLYRHVNDGPGSSTVDPVDPNQIVVILQQDLLIMREYTGEEIQYTLQKSLVSDAPAKANTPAMSKQVQADTFRGSASVRLTENGTYRLDLTNPEWDYSIYGEFDYGTTDVEPVMPDTPATKLIRNGHLLIQFGDKIYTLTGVEIQ